MLQLTDHCQRLDSSLREPTPMTRHLSSRTHTDDSNVSPSKLRHFTVSAPTHQAEKPPGFGKGRRSLRLPMVVATRFDSFFFFFDLFIFPILDYEIYLIVVFELHEKQKKKNTTSA